MSTFEGIPLDDFSDNALQITDEDISPPSFGNGKSKTDSDRIKKFLIILLVVSVVVLLMLLSFWMGYSAGFGSGYEVEAHHTCIVYSFDDFDTKRDHESIFSKEYPSFPVSIDTGITWDPEGEYHPLLDEEESPDWVFRYSTDYITDRNDPIQNAVQETIEYQIKVEEERFRTRKEALDELMDVVSGFLDPFITVLEEPKETFYYEIQYKTKKCGGDYSEFRSRSYITGSKANYSEIAINKDYPTKEEGMHSSNFLPAVGKDDIEMKLEQDVHPCKHKYNRKLTMKKEDYSKVFDCQEGKEYFPRVFNDTSTFEKHPMDIHSNKTWWAYSQSGYMFGNTTRFKYSCNIAYEDETMDDILNEVAIPNHSSEWSLRIYSYDDGYGVWDEYVLATMGQFYNYLLQNYGSYHEDPDDC